MLKCDVDICQLDLIVVVEVVVLTLCQDDVMSVMDIPMLVVPMLVVMEVADVLQPLHSRHRCLMLLLT